MSGVSTLAERVTFHVRHAAFNVREQFSDLASGIAGFLIFPFFIWLLAHLWERFSAPGSEYTRDQVMLYVGVTEILFLTFMRAESFGRASGDFSIGLARPRSWLAMGFSGIFGRALGSRIVYGIIFALLLPLLGVGVGATLETTARLALLLPALGIIQALLGLVFASSRVIWEQTNYFRLPVSKVFLVLGGVFAPLSDYSEPWRDLLISLPPSDLFFQPAHFSVTGRFFGMEPWEWGVRLIVQAALLAFFNLWLYRVARRRHQAYGG